MRDKRLKQLNMLTIIILGTAFLLMIFLSVAFKPKNQKSLDTSNLTEFNEDWVLRNYRGEEDQLISLPTKLDAEEDEAILILHRVPDDVNKDSVIVFETTFQNVRAYVGDLKVYENGVMNNQKIFKNAVPCLNIIDLSYAEPGDLITIYISSGYKRYRGKLGNIFYGTKGDVTTWLVKKHGVSFGFSILLILIVILLGSSLLFMKSVNVDKRRSGFAFAFIFSASLWSLLDNPIMQLLTSNRFGVYMSDMILLHLIPVLYMMYQRCFATKKRYARIFEIGLYVFAINFLTAIVFQFVDVCDFATYVVFTKILITLALVFLSGIMYLASDVFSDNTIYSNFCANTVLAAGAILEFILSLFKFYKPVDGLVIRVSLFIFLVLLVIAVEKSIIYEVNQITKRAIDDIEHEKDLVIKNVNTGLIYKSLAQAATNLKSTNLAEGKLIYDTSIYMRCNLNAAVEKGLVPFADELEYIKAYLGIQSKRYPKLDITVEDKVVNFKVPYNSIEPLVENSIENGAIKVDNAGRFVLRSYERLDCFAIQIVDNGPGINPEKSFLANTDYKSVKKRLKSLARAGIEVKSKPGKGSIITIKIPKDGYIIKEEDSII